MDRTRTCTCCLLLLVTRAAGAHCHLVQPRATVSVQSSAHLQYSDRTFQKGSSFPFPNQQSWRQIQTPVFRCSAVGGREYRPCDRVNQLRLQQPKMKHMDQKWRNDLQDQELWRVYLRSQSGLRRTMAQAQEQGLRGLCTQGWHAHQRAQNLALPAPPVNIPEIRDMRYGTSPGSDPSSMRKLR